MKLSTLVKSYRIDTQLLEQLSLFKLDSGFSLFNIFKTVFALLICEYSNKASVRIFYSFEDRQNDLFDFERKGSFLTCLERQLKVALTSTQFFLKTNNIFDKTHSVLSMSVKLEDNSLRYQLTTEENFLNEASLNQFSHHFCNLLEALIKTPSIELTEVSCLTAEAYSQIIHDYSEAKTQSNEIKTICQLFEQNAKNHSNHIALEYKNLILSYKELNEITNQLARYIRKVYQSLTHEELKPDTLIPISVGRSAEYVIGILAILKAGGAYVPINPDYPDSRIQFILTDINSRLILTETHLSEKFKSNDDELKQILLDEKLFLKEDVDDLHQQINSNDLAYVIYTSGSTGKPKGVLAQHRNVLSQVVCADYFHADSSDTMTFFSDVSFDSTTFEIWGALLNGAKLFVPEDLFDLLSNPSLFKETIYKKNITIILLTRALFDLLFSLDETVFAPLKFLLVGGEALTKNIMLKLLKSEYKPKYLINAYGPSENSTFCTTYYLNEDFSALNSVPIGRPYSNRVGYVVDSHLQLLPIGIVGELYVGGPSLSRGYLNRPELTAERFIANPFLEATNGLYPKIYKTNDMIKWLPSGVLEYSGRNDFQVKLRGYRIELGEIESRLLEFPGIKHSVVLLNQTDEHAYLVGYYVADEKLDEQIIRDFLASLLPEYMIPSVFIYLETLPVTTNGKLDRRALPQPDFQHGENKYYDDTQPVEQTIYSIWSKILNISNFGQNESFFNLGGNSLAAMKVRKELEDAFAIKLNIVDLFQHTSLKQLAEHISNLILAEQKNNKIVESKSEYHASQVGINEPIAIVGMACRLPGVKDPEAFWQLLLQEESNLRDFSIEELRANYVSESLIANNNYVKRGAVLEDSYSFDANFFGYSVKDAEIMDPQQRHFLECAWEALEYSGNIPEKFCGDIGVFASQGRNYYFMDNVYANQAFRSDTNLFQAILGNEKDFLSTRVSFKLNLTGPSITLQTACSSSLVSIQMACESLKNNGCDMALAGGVSLFYNHGYSYQEQMIESPDGYCRAFDAKTNGTVVTSGVGVVVLKRLSDAIKQRDTIYAVIKGGAINNDGSSKMAFTAPSVKGQVAVIERALKNANVSPDSISYIEAHGTGTLVGDPIEWKALHNVYEQYTSEKEFCTIGAVKTNIGHTDSAAGVFGLIKTALALKHQTIPATINFKSLNPEIASFNTLFRVSNKAYYWETEKIRRAAVSSFGLGGTNAHLILEEYQNNIVEEDHDVSSYCLLPFSAKNRESLFAMATQLKNYFKTSDGIDLRNCSYTLQEGRAEMEERGYFLLSEHPDDKDRIKASYLRDSDYKEKSQIIFVLNEPESIAFEQFNLLYKNYSVFKQAFDTCAVIIQQHHHVDITKTNSGELCSKLLAFSSQYALCQLLHECEVKAYGWIVSGIGAWVAASVLGIFSLKDAIALSLSKENSVYPAINQNHSKAKLFSYETNNWGSDENIHDSTFWNNLLTYPKSLNPNIQTIHSDKTVFVAISNCGFDDQQKLLTRIFPNNQQCAEVVFLKSIAWLWSQGVPIVWNKINPANRFARKIRMPTYCFVKKHYEIKKSIANVEPIQNAVNNETASLKNSLKEMWSNVLGIAALEITDSSHFLDLGGDSLTFIDLFAVIKKSFLPTLKLEEIIDYNEFGEMFSFIDSRITN